MLESLTIVGVCGGERRRYARLAAATDRRLRVTDLPADSEPVALHAALHSSETLCVVDARHLLDDLRGPTPLRRAAPDTRSDIGARARQGAIFIELAGAVVLVNWEQVPTAELSLIMALVSHLAPTSRIRLSRGVADDLAALSQTAPTQPTEVGERPGWTHVLNGTHDPSLTDRRVSSLRYEQLRPFHPTRLMTALNEIDGGRGGLLLRSAGLCRLATRPDVSARWEQAGSAMWIDPQEPDLEWAGVGQEIALTGIDLHAGWLRDTLDDAALTDIELAAGPDAWTRFADPLPPWPTSARRDEPLQ